jgi:hypothetical protein
MYHINKYSWFLLAIYTSVIFIMNYHTYIVSLEGFYLTIPLIIGVIIWSEKTSSIINKATRTKSIEEIFQQDLFLISYSFILGSLLSFIFNFNNSDVRGWWPMALYIITYFGVLFAFIFSLSGKILNNHKKYTFAFFYLIIVLIPLLSFLPYIWPFSIYGKRDFFYEAMSLLLGIHLLCCLGQKILLVVRSKKL